jgi:Family of unknown function (DUF6282)
MPVTFPTRDNQPELPGNWDEPEVDGLIEGAVDLHVHPFPSPFPRRMGIVEATKDAEKAKYRAIVVKSHHHSMVPDVLALHETGLGDSPVQVFGGVALNPQVGGINPYAVDLALNLGGKIVWFPTISSHAHHHHLEEGGTFPNATITLRQGPALSILDEAGKVKPEVFDILEQIRDHDAILTGGHLPASEIDILFTEAQKLGVQRILVNHPNFIVGASPELAGEWARKGIYIEHSVGMYDNFFGSKKSKMEFPVLAQYITAAGAGKTMLVSDTGQLNNPRPVDVIKIAIKQLLDHDYDEKSIRSMVGGNAGQLLLG